ncbi:MAG: HalD/BesD family halogenase [Hyphomicrobiales bacterium]
MRNLAEIVDIKAYPLSEGAFREACKSKLDSAGVLTMPGFLEARALGELVAEAHHLEPNAFFRPERHNVFLHPSDPSYADDHPRNRLVSSSKGCVCDDEVSVNSHLRTLYGSELFKEFLCDVLGEQALHPYADPLSSINIHYARAGEELGWHFDNSSFAVTLMLQAPEAGGEFEYVPGVRDADAGEMNFAAVADVLDGAEKPKHLSMPAGTLVLFRGRNALHRVAPVEGGVTRMLVVLAYNSEPGIALSESARETFYGRLQ